MSMMTKSEDANEHKRKDANEHTSLETWGKYKVAINP